MSESVQCSHLLIKHDKSRNPISRRTNKSTLAMSKDDARKELSEILHDLQTKQKDDPEGFPKYFTEKSYERSDCGSYRNGGDLGPFTRGQMQKPFEDASFSLNVGELSTIVDTDSGLHIIYRTN